MVIVSYSSKFNPKFGCSWKCGKIILSLKLKGEPCLPNFRIKFKLSSSFSSSEFSEFDDYLYAL